MGKDIVLIEKNIGWLFKMVYQRRTQEGEKMKITKIAKLRKGEEFNKEGVEINWDDLRDSAWYAVRFVRNDVHLGSEDEGRESRRLFPFPLTDGKTLKKYVERYKSFADVYVYEPKEGELPPAMGSLSILDWPPLMQE